MVKSFFISANRFSAKNEVSLLTINSDVFLMALYEELYKIIEKKEKISLYEKINILETGVWLYQVLEENEKGDFFYRIKDIEVFDIGKMPLYRVGNNANVKFLVEQKKYSNDNNYLPDDDSICECEVSFVLVACETIQAFKEKYFQECIKHSKEDQNVEFSGLFFDVYDAYDIKILKNKQKTIIPIYPQIITIN